MELSATTNNAASTIYDAMAEMLERTKKQSELLGKSLSNEISKIYSDEKKNPVSYQAKMERQALVKFPESSNIPSWVVKSCSKPTIERKLFIKKSIIIELYDPINPSSTQSVLNLFNADKFELGILTLDPIGVVVEEFTLSGCRIEKIDWSDIDYSSDKPVVITLKISFKESKVK